MRYLSLGGFGWTRPIVILILSFLFLVIHRVPDAHAELRKRVLISAPSADAPTQDIVKGSIAKELGRYDDILVIDDRFEQSFLPQMKYKGHVIVQVDILQLYAEETDRKTVGQHLADVGRMAVKGGSFALYPATGGLSILFAAPLYKDAEAPPRNVKGHVVANVALFDMSTERSFARTQTDLSFYLKGSARNAKQSDEDIILTHVSAAGFRGLSKWIVKEIHRRPGQTWVFSQTAERAFVNAGSLDGVRRGQKLKVFRPYDIFAPGTTNVVGRAAEYAGAVRVIHVDELFSIAEPIRFSLSGEYITK